MSEHKQLFAGCDVSEDAVAATIKRLDDVHPSLFEAKT